MALDLTFVLPIAIVGGALLLIAMVLICISCCVVNNRHRNAPKDESKPVVLIITQIDGIERMWAQDAAVTEEVVQQYERLMRVLISAHGCYEVSLHDHITFTIATDSVATAVEFCEDVQSQFYRQLLLTDFVDQFYAAEDRQRAVVDSDARAYMDDVEAGKVANCWRGLRVRVSAHVGKASIQKTSQGYDYEGDVARGAIELSAFPAGGQIVFSQPFVESMPSESSKKRCRPLVFENPAFRLYLPGFGISTVFEYVIPEFASRWFPTASSMAFATPQAQGLDNVTVFVVRQPAQLHCASKLSPSPPSDTPEQEMSVVSLGSSRHSRSSAQVY